MGTGGGGGGGGDFDIDCDWVPCPGVDVGSGPKTMGA